MSKRRNREARRRNVERRRHRMATWYWDGDAQAYRVKEGGRFVSDLAPLPRPSKLARFMAWLRS